MTQNNSVERLRAWCRNKNKVLRGGAFSMELLPHATEEEFLSDIEFLLQAHSEAEKAMIHDLEFNLVRREKKLSTRWLDKYGEEKQ